MSHMPTAIERAAEWLATSPRVLIGAGAGLSASAGIDYTDTHAFRAAISRDETARLSCVL